MVGIFILGMFTRSANATGVLTGAATSIAMLYYVTFYTNVHFFLYAVIGIGTAVFVGYVVSLVTGRPSNDLDGLTRRTLKPAGIDR